MRNGALDIASGSYLLGVFLNTGGTFITSIAMPNPVKKGQPVTFTVSVAASVIAQAVPTGTITLKDGSKTIATLTLKNGHAVFNTSKESAGTHTITATYSGDSNFLPNSAKPITLVVNP